MPRSGSSEEVPEWRRKEGFGIPASGVGKEEPTADSQQPAAKNEKPAMNLHCRLSTVDCRLRDVATAADRMESLRTEPIETHYPILPLL